MVALGGHVWLLLGGCAWFLPGVRDCSQGACVVAPGGACMVAPRGCMVAPGGVCGCSKGVCMGYDKIRRPTVNERAVRILLECILVLYCAEIDMQLRLKAWTW